MIKRQAESIAARGYRVLLPDLYNGKLGVDKEEAMHLFNNLDWPRAVGQIKEAVEVLREGGSPRVGTIGFCMGGALALAAAQHAGVDCAVACYGIPPDTLAQPEAIKVPVLLQIGCRDEHAGFSDPETAEKWVARVRAAGGQVELNLYKEAGHGFMNEGEDATATRKMMGHYEPSGEDQRRGWETSFQFLSQHLVNA